MSLLYPIYLLGALAIALPVYLHLKRKPPRGSQPVSSLLFWRPSETLSRRRTSKIEDWLLLALRCLAILLLVLVFARPFTKDQSKFSLGQKDGSRYVFVVDTSASMQRKDAWPQTLKHVRRRLDKLTPKDEVALYRFDHQVESVVSFKEWNGLSEERGVWLKEQIKNMVPTWGSSSIDLALIRAVEAIQEIATVSTVPVAKTEVILISDLQQGGDWERLSSIDWPKDVELTILRVDADVSNNAALGAVVSNDPSKPKVRITNHPEHQAATFKLTWTSANLYESQYIAPGQSTVVAAPAGFPPLSPLTLTGDQIEFDNTVYFPLPEPAKPNIALWSDSLIENKSSLAFYLDQAMIKTHRMEPVLSRDLSQLADFYVVDGSISEQAAQRLRKEINAGKSCLFVVDRPEAVGPLATILADDSVRVTSSGKTNDYTLFENIDFKHPVLKPFAAIETRDFSNIRVWNYRTVTAKDTDSLIDFEEGQTALFEKAVGEGKLLGLTTSWSSDDSQLARSTKFVPLLYSIFNYCGIQAGANESFLVGDRLPINRDFKTDQPIKLVGVKEQIDREDPFVAFRPGFFEFSQGDKKITYVANLDPKESLLEPMSLESFGRFGISTSDKQTKTTADKPKSQARLSNIELESQQKWFRWLAVLVFLFLIIETVLGGRRPVTVQPQQNITPTTT